MQCAGYCQRFFAKKSIQPAVLAADPSREEAEDDVGSQDPNTEWPGKAGFGITVWTMSYTARLSGLQDAGPAPVGGDERAGERASPVGQSEHGA